MSQIQRLPQQTSDRIHATTRITTLYDVARELVFNSIDAQATAIAVTVDLDEKGFVITVKDNGSGILPSCFDLLGEINASSKSKDTSRFLYGHHGQALWCMAQLSTMEIISKTRTSKPHHMILNKAKPLIKRFYPKPQSIGTSVTITDLFWNVPVRQRTHSPSLTQVKQLIERIAMIHPSIAFSLNEYPSKTILSSPVASSMLDRFFSLRKEQVFKGMAFKKFKQETNEFIVEGFMACQLIPSNQFQYLYINNRWAEDHPLSIRVNAMVKTITNANATQHPVYLIHICELSEGKSIQYGPIGLLQDIIERVFSKINEVNQKTTSTKQDCPCDQEAKSERPQRETTPAMTPQHVNRKSLKRSYSHADADTTKHPSEATWIKESLKSWKNPIHQVKSLSVPTPLTLKPFIMHKSQLSSIEVISQWDKKFICALLHSPKSKMLVLFDQHAVDERVKLETLQQTLTALSLSQPLVFDLSKSTLVMAQEELIHRLQLYSHAFERWKIVYTLDEHMLTVTTLPHAVHERIMKRPQLMLDLLCTHIQHLTQHPSSTSMPVRLLYILQSLACRSAIKFNDVLTLTECQILVRNLQECQVPFQCAHGRPNIYPLLELPL